MNHVAGIHVIVIAEDADLCAFVCNVIRQLAPVVPRDWPIVDRGDRNGSGRLRGCSAVRNAVGNRVGAIPIAVRIVGIVTTVALNIAVRCRGNAGEPDRVSVGIAVVGQQRQRERSVFVDRKRIVHRKRRIVLAQNHEVEGCAVGQARAVRYRNSYACGAELIRGRCERKLVFPIAEARQLDMRCIVR